MQDEENFGTFIRKKRTEKSPYLSLRKMAEQVGLSPVHMSNIETGREAAPKADILIKLSKILCLDNMEETHMYDLAAESKHYAAVPSDLPEYIRNNEYVRSALRTARDLQATDAEWIEFIEKLNKRKGEEDAVIPE